MTITEISLIIIQGWIDYMTINEKIWLLPKKTVYHSSLWPTILVALSPELKDIF